MIDYIHLVNFRSYKDTLLEFHPGVNVIIGENDIGKTNVIRGIDLVANNHPRGDDYVSDWGGDLNVTLGVDNKEVGRFRNVVWDKKLEKYKAGTTNQYTLSGDKPFNAVGSKVPEPISRHLNLSPTNIHFQLDGPFLLNKTPTEVAKHYNKIVNLEIIDRTMGNIAGTLRKEKAQKAVVEADIETGEEKLKAFDWLEGAETELSRLEKDLRGLSKMKTDWTELYHLTNNHKKLMQADSTLNEITKHEGAVNSLLELEEEIQQLEAHHKELDGLVFRHTTLMKTKEKLDQIIQYEKVVDSLLQQQVEIEALQNDKRELSTIVRTFNRLRKEESECQEIVKHSDVATKLAALDVEITEGIAEYNVLQEMVEKWYKLNDEFDDANNELMSLETEFAEILPARCPIFDVKCSHIEEAKK